MHKAPIRNGPYGTSLCSEWNKLNVAYGKARNVDRTKAMKACGIPRI